MSRRDLKLYTAQTARLRARLAGDAYSLWRAAQDESAEALERWFSAPRGDRRREYDTYRAALEREEAAARSLEQLRPSAER